MQSQLHALELRNTTSHSHGGHPPVLNIVRSGHPGRPRYEITEDYLRFAYHRRSISSMAESLGVHRNTVRKALLRYGIATPLASPFVEQTGGDRVVSYTRPLSHITDDVLDATIRRIREREGFGRAGISVLHGLLLADGHRVPRERIRLSLSRIDPQNRGFRARMISRRTYTVAGPNAVWHHDGQHGAYSILPYF